MLDYQLLSEAFGLVACFFFLWSTGTSNDRLMNKLGFVGCVALGAHLYLSGELLALLGITLAAFRNIFALFYNKKFVRIGFMLGFFSLLGYALFNYNFWYELLTPLAGVIVSYSILYTEKNQRSFWILFATILWFIYGVTIDSFSIVLLEISCLFSLIFRVIKQNNLKPNLKYLSYLKPKLVRK